jgi:hypothetical protein
VWIADTSEKIAAAFGRQHLTLLVDEAAMHSLASMLGACSDGERDMILVGEGATAAESAAFGVGRVVPFSRNALAEALDPAPSRETATLHHLPTGRVSRGSAAQSGRMARVSRA